MSSFGAVTLDKHPRAMVIKRPNSSIKSTLPTETQCNPNMSNHRTPPGSFENHERIKRSISNLVGSPSKHSTGSRSKVENSKRTDTLNSNFETIDLKGLTDEYYVNLNKYDCEKAPCNRFKFLSHHINKQLSDKICHLESSIEAKRGKQTNMDEESLMNLVIEKERRIQDLEKLVDDQKRLRLQDASQVEEKAARIKEWVANKLKELENQNKQLRDQNRKHKETVQSLTARLASMSPISSPMKARLPPPDLTKSVSSDLDRFEVERPLRLKRPPLKKSFLASNLSDYSIDKSNVPASPIHKDLSPEASPRYLKPKNSPLVLESHHIDSPIYDSVSADQLAQRAELCPKLPEAPQNESMQNESKPPPPPLHQSDKWEQDLYKIAEELSSTLRSQGCPTNPNWCDNQTRPDSFSNSSMSDKDVSISRKSSTSLRNNLSSLVKPTLITIDGDSVIDGLHFQEDSEVPKRISDQDAFCQPLSLGGTFKNPVDPKERFEKPMTPTILDSPMRSRSTREGMLRTQSMRRHASPEQLYEFLLADVVKRGYLGKPGALKTHSRWIVLRNFHIFTYKTEHDESSKCVPSGSIRLDSSSQVAPLAQTNETSFPFKITANDKTLQLVADSSSSRDEWLRIITVAINMSDITPDMLSKENSEFETIMGLTRQGHTKKHHAVLMGHILFFLRSIVDPTPVTYVSIKEARIREVTYNCDYDLEELEILKLRKNSQDCSLAIYPKYSLYQDPLYITLGNQCDFDRWFYHLSNASGIDQAFGTEFERTLTTLMVDNSLITSGMGTKALSISSDTSSTGCLWRMHPIMLYNDRPLSKPLTSLPNETLKQEALEMFKSLLLFTQVSIEPVAIDYHVCLLQNCLARFQRYPELRNEFFAQLIKQSTFVLHRCQSQKCSSGSSGCSSNQPRLSHGSISPSSSECQFVTDVLLLEQQNGKADLCSSSSHIGTTKDKNENSYEEQCPPSRSELLQVIQIISLVVSLNLPRGRLRWWLKDHLRKFSNSQTNIGKYALYSLDAVERTIANGPRDYVSSRMEIMSILMRNPYEHSKPHSFPINFFDGSYLVVEVDGSTTVQELTVALSNRITIRVPEKSDFYIFADDPSGSKDLFILEPQRKVLDVFGWWEHAFRRVNSGRYQNTRTIKLLCKKRLVLQQEEGETQQERLLIVHQINQEISLNKIPLSPNLTPELGALMAQLTFGDYNKSKDPQQTKCLVERAASSFLTRSTSSQSDSLEPESVDNLVERWRKLSGKSAQDCVRIYLNCMRRLNCDRS